MEISPLVWTLTIVFIVALLAFDFIFHVRKAHIPTLGEAAVWSSIYVGIADPLRAGHPDLRRSGSRF